MIMTNTVDMNSQENFRDSQELTHSDYITSKNLIYDPLKFKCSHVLKENESAEYGAYTFQLNAFVIKFRVAKITPMKVGQFVTIWKRAGKNSPIQPYDVNDHFNFFVICVRQDNNFGQFVFSKSVLLKHGIISENSKGGKRAIRVYPTWEKLLNKQAQKTQNWQLDYFLNASSIEAIDYSRVEKLYSLK